jgi:hypothetical protein
MRTVWWSCVGSLSGPACIPRIPARTRTNARLRVAFVLRSLLPRLSLAPPPLWPPPPRHSLHRHAAALPDQREARRSCQPVKRQCPPAPRHHRCDGWDVSGATHVTRPLFGDVAPLQVGVTISAPTREGNVVRAMMSHMVKLRCRTVCLFGGYLFSTFF